MHNVHLSCALWRTWAIVTCTETNVGPVQSQVYAALSHVAHPPPPWPRPPTNCEYPLNTHSLHLPHLLNTYTVIFKQEMTHYITLWGSECYSPFTQNHPFIICFPLFFLHVPRCPPMKFLDSLVTMSTSSVPSNCASTVHPCAQPPHSPSYWPFQPCSHVLHDLIYLIKGGDRQPGQCPPRGGQHPDAASPLSCYDKDSWDRHWWPIGIPHTFNIRLTSKKNVPTSLYIGMKLMPILSKLMTVRDFTRPAPIHHTYFCCHMPVLPFRPNKTSLCPGWPERLRTQPTASCYINILFPNLISLIPIDTILGVV